MRQFLLEEQRKIKEYLDTIEYPGFSKTYLGANLQVQALDQKVTWDALNTTCKCIKHMLSTNGSDIIFHHNDFLNDEFSKQLFSDKKDQYGGAALQETNLNEYDKLFWNNFEALAYTGILEKVSQKPRCFKAKNIEMLNLLAQSQEACICYVCINALKLLKCSDFANIFVRYLAHQTRENKNLIKTHFTEWLKRTTGHRNDIGQIYQKFINPLFYLFELPKYMSNKQMRELGIRQSVADLSIFRLHRRDTNRIHGYTRHQMEETIRNFVPAPSTPSWDKIKENIKKWNQEYYHLSNNEYKSELSEHVIYDGVHIHHIKMKSDFTANSPLPANSYENLIILNPSEHDNRAHRNGNVTLINIDNLNIILWRQYSKIVNFNSRHIGEYDLEKFYKLTCYIKNVGTHEAESIEVLKGYIEEVICLPNE